jgi:hypothetical protein
MPKTKANLLRLGCVVMAALTVRTPSVDARDPLNFDLDRERVLPKELDLGFMSSDAPSAPTRPNRIRLFRIQPGFLSDPVGLEDDPLPQDVLPNKADDGPNWLEVAVGNDNPFFDVRYPGDPGGIGYTRVHTQVQLLDLPSTGCSVGFQAVTPTGAQQGGIEDGPTVISPAFAIFHSLEDGTAFQGFVAKNLHVSTPASVGDTFAHSSQFGRSVHCGMAVQRPVAPELNNVYWFVEALGRYHYDQTSTTTTPAAWELLPGMHLKMSDSLWLSGGVILPVNRDRPIDGKLWQITCSFQF